MRSASTRARWLFVLASVVFVIAATVPASAAWAAREPPEKGAAKTDTRASGPGGGVTPVP